MSYSALSLSDNEKTKHQKYSSANKNTGYTMRISESPSSDLLQPLWKIQVRLTRDSLSRLINITPCRRKPKQNICSRIGPDRKEWWHIPATNSSFFSVCSLVAVHKPIRYTSSSSANELIFSVWNNYVFFTSYFWHFKLNVQSVYLKILSGPCWNNKARKRDGSILDFFFFFFAFSNLFILS